MNQNQTLSQEDILIALDQLDQTVEVMSNIIRRLKHSLDDSLSPGPLSPNPQDNDTEQNALASAASVNVSFDTNLH